MESNYSISKRDAVANLIKAQLLIQNTLWPNKEKPRLSIEEKAKMTFVSKSHNALKLSEKRARKLFDAGEIIILRPSGRNTLERGVIYKKGEYMLYQDRKTAETFDDAIEDFKTGFGRPYGNDEFRYYLFAE